MFLTSTACMLACFIVWTALESTFEKQVAASGAGSPAVGRAVLAMIFIYNAAFNIAWAPLQVTYVVEILPYQMRARVCIILDKLRASLIRDRVWCYTTSSCPARSSSTNMLTRLHSRLSNGSVSAANIDCQFSTLITHILPDYIVYDVWLLVELAVVYFLFVETSGSSLEEMAAIIDGEDARDEIIEAVARVTDGKAVEQREEMVDDKRPHVVVA